MARGAVLLVIPCLNVARRGTRCGMPRHFGWCREFGWVYWRDVAGDLYDQSGNVVRRQFAEEAGSA